MKFLHPGWLWALLALLPVFLAMLWDERQRKGRFAKFALESTWRTLSPEVDFSARLRKGVVWLLALAFGFVALARPQWGMHEETAKITGMDVMFVLDISNSMEVEDVMPSRLQKAKHFIKSVTERISGDRVGLVTFAASAAVSCPLTTDADYMLGEVQIANPEMAATQGTDIGLGLETARRALDRGGEQGPSDSEGAGPDALGSHAIVLISDGEDWENSATEAAHRIKESGIKLFVFGVGTQKGGPIPERDQDGVLRAYKKDPHGQPIISQFKPDALEEIAQAAGGKYWNVTDNGGEIDAFEQEVAGMSRGQLGERKYAVFEDRYQYPLFIAILLLLIEMAIPARRILPREGRGTAGAGLALFALAVLGLGGLGAGARDAQAAPLNAYLDNEKGIRDLSAGKIDAAKKEFGNAQAVIPDSPELLYNEGVVQLQGGDADSAIQSFLEAAKKTEHGDPKLHARALYNLGEALSKKGDFKGAAKSYIDAIEKSQRIQDGKLEAEARKNLELLDQQKQKQKQQQQQKKDQQQQQQQQQQSQDQKNQQKPQGGSNQKNDQQQQAQNQSQPKDQKDQKDDKKNQEKDQPERYKDEQQQQFHSQKLTPEDADRVMQELRQQERDLEAKLNKKNGTTPNDHDW